MGTGYAYDHWVWKIDDAPSTPDAEQILKIIVEITNPPVIFTITDHWFFTLMTSDSSVNDDTPPADDEALNFADYDTAKIVGDVGDVPEVSDVAGLITTTVYEKTTANTLTIDGGNDGINTMDATYTFLLKNNQPVPYEGVMVITVPSAVTIPDDDPDELTLTCTSGCKEGAHTWEFDAPTLTITGAFSTDGYWEGKNANGIAFSI